MIAPEFIQELLERTDIVQIIGSHVDLRKAGRSYKGLCPFHEEKTPSFSVNPTNQFYHCFGCGVSGTAIDFLMRKTGLPFPDTIEDLAQRIGMTVVHDKDTQQKHRNYDELYEILERVSKWYQRKLVGPEGSKARAYLDQRGVNESLREQYDIGYAPDGWDNLKALFDSEDQQQKLLNLGLLTRSDKSDRSYDRFRNRIIFPIRNYKGRVVGFGGRAMSDEDKAKYLNSPESEVFHKGRELYGVNQLRARHGRIKCLYVVEGYMDVIALAQHGVADVVATMGTAIGDWALQSLFRYSPCVVMCFDGDRAGRQAAKRALEMALPQLNSAQNLRFLFLPEGDDPDSFVRREGQERFTDMGKSVGLYEFLLQNIQTEAGSIEAPEDTARMLEVAGGYVRRLGDPIMRELLLKELATRSGLDASFLKEELLQRGKKPSSRASKPKEDRQQAAGSTNPLLTKIIQLLLHRPALAQSIDVNIEEINRWNIKGVDFLIKLLNMLHKNPDITMATIIENWRDTPYETRLRALAADDFMPEDDQGKQTELADAIERLQQQVDKQRLKSLVRQPHTDLSPEQVDEIRRLQSRIAHKTSPSVTTK